MHGSTQAGYVSWGRLRSNKNRKFYAEIQAITNHVVWQYIPADNASCCRLTICGKIIIYTIMGALTKYVVWQYTPVVDASCGRLRSCGKIIISAKIRPLPNYILWQCTLAGYSCCGRVGSNREKNINAKILAITCTCCVTIHAGGCRILWPREKPRKNNF